MPAGRSPDGIGGSMTRAVDTADLETPADLYDGLRLDYRTYSEADGRYHDGPFQRNGQTVQVIRFVADGTPNVIVPRNSSMGGGGKYDNWKLPFTGNGFTGASDTVVPEFDVVATMSDGAEMWEVTDTGTQRLTAVLQNGQWVKVD
jgi:hypothetical protein